MVTACKYTFLSLSIVMPPTGMYSFVASRVFTARINSSIPRSTEMDTTSYNFNGRRLDLVDLDRRKLMGGADGICASGDRIGADGAGISGDRIGADGSGISGDMGGADAICSGDMGGADTTGICSGDEGGATAPSKDDDTSGDTSRDEGGADDPAGIPFFESMFIF